MQPKRTPLAIALVLLLFSSHAQVKDICVLDLTAKNSESTSGNFFSIGHILKSEGFSFTTTLSVIQESQLP